MPIHILLVLVLLQTHEIICLRISSGHRSIPSPLKGQARNGKELTALGAVTHQ